MPVSSPSTSLSLLDRLRAGDQDAWHRLVTLYTPLLRAWLLHAHLQPADRDDVIQNTLTVILRKLPTYEHNGRRGAFRKWLRQIILHSLHEHRRASGKHPGNGDALLDELEDPHSELNQRWEQEHDHYLLRGLLDYVRGEFVVSTWEAFRRTALLGESAAVVAQELGLTVNAVHIARSRVLARLRLEASAFLGEL